MIAAPITPEEAAARNLRPLAGPYRPNEAAMARAVCRDMRRGNISHAVVEGPSGLEVWRSNHGWRAD